MSDETAAQVIDGETGQLDPSPRAIGKDGKPRRRIDLSTLRDVRLEMANVYREMEAGTIEDAAGTKRVYVLRNIADVITVAEIERRLIELEDKQQKALPGSQRPFGQARLN